MAFMFGSSKPPIKPKDLKDSLGDRFAELRAELNKEAAKVKAPFVALERAASDLEGFAKRVAEHSRNVQRATQAEVEGHSFTVQEAVNNGNALSAVVSTRVREARKLRTELTEKHAKMLEAFQLAVRGVFESALDSLPAEVPEPPPGTPFGAVLREMQESLKKPEDE